MRIDSQNLLRAIGASITGFLMAVAGTSAQTADGIRVLQSGPAELVVQIDPRIDTTRLITGDILPKVASSVMLNARNGGAPLELAVSLPVALPAAKGNTLEVISVTYGSPVAGRVAPVPSLRTDEQGMVEESYKANPDAYAAYVPSGEVARLEYMGIARDVHSGQIRVLPYRYDPKSGTITFLTSIKLRLRYAGGGVTRGPRRSGDEFSVASFVNAGQAVNWSAVALRERTFPKRSATGAARAWMRVEVKEEGLYEIVAEDFQKGGIDLSTVDPNRIAIYGGNGMDLPVDVSSADSNRMRQIPTIVETDGGKVKRVLFYGVGPSGWTYNFNDTVPVHVVSPYVTANSYIIAVDGDQSRGFTRQEPVGQPDFNVGSGLAHVFYDDDQYNAIAVGNGGAGSGTGWFGAQFIVGDGRTSDVRPFTQPLPGLDRSRPVIYRVRVGHTARKSTGTFRVEQNSTLLGDISLNSLYDTDNMLRAGSKVFHSEGSAVPGDNQSMLKLTYFNPGEASGYLDYYEIHYWRNLTANDDAIMFESPTGSGVGAYTVNGFSTGDVIGLDVTDPANPVELTRQGSGDYLFHDRLRPARNQARRYFLTGRNKVKRVASASSVDYGRLRERMLDADVVVITHKDFKAAADDYAAYRNGLGRYSTAVVTTSEIYTEFSNGNLDPTAIRDYLAFAMRNWNRQPSYVLLIGDGSFDYRKISTKQEQFVPTFESFDGDSYDRIYSSAYDDYYARVTGDDYEIDLMIGRIPAEKLEEAEVAVSKIKQYEGSRNFGTWRQTVVLVADDNYPAGEGSEFLSQSEDIWRDYLPNWMDPKKIYLANYPTVQGAVRSKPGAAQDLLAAVNRGAVITNWVGHGNPNVWGHEGVLNKDQFIPKMTNDSMLTLVSAVTCNFGRFDDPATPSGGELFLLKEGGGAVAVLATTRGVFIHQNEALMKEYFSKIMLREVASKQFLNIGQAMLAAKRRGNADFGNDQKYILFGDPTLLLNMPRDSVEITAINAKSIAVDTATVGALSLVTVEGMIRDRVGTLREDFNGTAIVTLYDADPPMSVTDEGVKERMTLYGGQLFRGPATVTNGRFTAQFRMPKDIAFDSNTARLHVYAYNDREDAAGATTNLRVFGSDTTNITDHDGPEIEVFLDDRTFRTGDVVTQTPMLIVDLKDANGINSSGAGLGHRIEAWIDGHPEAVDLTETYLTSETDYRVGTAERELIDLKPGEHKLRVRGWDIFNNPAEATVFFKIVDDAEDEALRVSEVANYPNPMGRKTDFLFRHNQTAPLDVDVAIFTAGGRKIRQLEARSVTDRFVRVHWDGTDEDGDMIANGIYYYRLRVRVTADESKGEFETIQKVAVAR